MSLLKNIFIDCLYGILVIIAVTIFEFLVTLPFGEGQGSINLELLLASIPALLITFTFGWLTKIKDKGSALRRSIIWTAALALWYMVIGIGNDNFASIFSSIGIYVLLVCSFAGTLLYSQIKKLK